MHIFQFAKCIKLQKSVISIGQKDQVKQKRNKYKSAHGECKKSTKSLKSLKSLTKKSDKATKRHGKIIVVQKQIKHF